MEPTFINGRIDALVNALDCYSYDVDGDFRKDRVRNIVASHVENIVLRVEADQSKFVPDEIRYLEQELEKKYPSKPEQPEKPSVSEKEPEVEIERKVACFKVASSINVEERINEELKRRYIDPKDVLGIEQNPSLAAGYEVWYWVTERKRG